MSDAGQDEAAASLKASEAAVETAQAECGRGGGVAAAGAGARIAGAGAAARTVASTREQVQNAKALADQASVELGYAKVFAPVTGQGECAGGAAGRSAGARAARLRPSWT